jgi:hypothetical protein
MASLNICECYLQIKDPSGDPYRTAELVLDPRKSMMHAQDSVYISKLKRITAAPGIVVQDLLFVSVSPESTTTPEPSIIYTSGGTAGSEVVSVVLSDITIQIQTGVSTATQIKAAFDASIAATLIASCVITGTGSNTQISFSPAVDFSDSYALLDIAETTTDSQPVVFEVNWDDGSNYGTIVYDPINIPDQTSVDLSTLLTVSRG